MRSTAMFCSGFFGAALVLSAGITGANSEPAMPKGLWEAFGEARHAIEPATGDADAGYKAQNPGNHLVFRFGEEGLTVEPADAGRRWALTMTLTAFGQEGSVETPGPAEVVVDGQRVEYRRAGLTEWYVNEPRGLEQGFTIDRPMGFDPGRAVILAIDLSGGLTPSVTDGGRGLSFSLPTGHHAFNYSGLAAFDADRNQIPANLALTAGRLEIRVEVGDRSWPVTVDPVISTETKLQGLHDDAAYFDRFGWQVSVSGDTALVGSEDDDDAGISSGSAYVFVRVGSGWIFQAKLTASDAAEGDQFGGSVSISGDTALVGAYNEDGAGSSRGSAYVFVRSGTAWSEQQKLTASDAADGDRFGHSVSVAGDTVLVGAIYDDDGGVFSGSAYVFVRSGTTWTQQQKLTAPDAVSGDYFGYDVSVSGDTVLVGVPSNDFAAANAGAADVFVRSGSTWSHQKRLVASDAAIDDFVGESVSLAGDTAIVGARADDHAGSYSGSAYVFFRSGSTWSQQAKLTASDAAAGDQFGSEVSLSGDTILVGAYSDDDGGDDSGSVYVFLRSGTSWSQWQKVTASDAAAGDYFGASVSVSGDIAVIGAVFDDGPVSDSGSAYVFVRSGATWSEASKLTAVVAAAGDSFGAAVSVSGDHALVGAPWDDDVELNAGAAYVFVRSGDGWSRQAKLTAPDAAALANFGTSVSLSGDTALVGAPGDGGGGFVRGAAYVFVQTGESWTQQAKLIASDAEDSDGFGNSVQVSGDLAVCGATGEDEGGSYAGAVYVFQRTGSSWYEQAKLTASDAAADDLFGWAVSVSGDTVLIGSVGDGDGGFESGSAYVFVRSGTAWSEQQKLLAYDAGDGDHFGISVSVLGDTAVIGARAGDGGIIDSGTAYLFERSGTTWKLHAKLVASDAEASDGFGASVSLSAKTAVIGSKWDDDAGDDSGSAYVYVRGGAGWLESVKLMASDANALDRFGGNVSVSGDTVLVGSPDDDDGADGSGSAYVRRFQCGFGAGIAPGRWSLIGIPCDLGAADTIEEVFGDNLLPADYGLTWIIYRRDETADVYVPLTLSSFLDQGRGYWIYSTEWGVWDASGARTAYTQSGLCVSPKGCFEEFLTPPDAPTTHRWNLVGHPGNQATNWSGVAVNVDGTRYNSPSDAEDAGFISKTIHKYTGAAYDAFDDVTPGMEGMIESQEGFWVEALPDSSGHTVSLLIPDGMAPGAPPGPPGMPEVDPSEVGEWYVRLIAETHAEGLVDRGNVLGQLLEAEDDYDAHDLFELDPFADPHLTIVFPHPDWGDRAGDYASDYHLSDGELNDEWILEVRTDDAWREVRLAWEPLRVLESVEPTDGEQRRWTLSDLSGEALMDTMWLQDLATGGLIKAAEDGIVGDYVFNMNGETVRVFRWFAELSELNSLFADGFESGDLSAWSEAEP